MKRGKFLYPDSFLQHFPQCNIFLKPLGNRCFVNLQEQVSVLVPNHLCRDVIRKNVASVLFGVKPPAIIDTLPV